MQCSLGCWVSLYCVPHLLIAEHRVQLAGLEELFYWIIHFSEMSGNQGWAPCPHHGIYLRHIPDLNLHIFTKISMLFEFTSTIFCLELFTCLIPWGKVEGLIHVFAVFQDLSGQLTVKLTNVGFWLIHKRLIALILDQNSYFFEEYPALFNIM